VKPYVPSFLESLINLNHQTKEGGGLREALEADFKAHVDLGLSHSDNFEWFRYDWCYEKARMEVGE